MWIRGLQPSKLDDELETPHLSAYSTGENRLPHGTSLPNSGRAISTPQGGAGDSSSLSSGNNTGIPSEDIQAEFRNIRDSYCKVNLPGDVRLSTERSGIKRDDTQKLNIISNCARYSETVLRILASSNSESLSSELVQELSVCVYAQQRYLQDEYAILLVNSGFNSQTAKLYRQLQKNTSAFPPGALANLQAAATIAAAASSVHSDPGHGHFRGRGNFRGRYHNYRSSSDAYASMLQSNIPSTRPDDQED